MLYTVSIPVADLRRDPVAPSSSYAVDRLQESQVLFGEHLLIKDEVGPYVRVAALDQPRWHEGGWRPYEGWILRSSVEALAQPNVRAVIQEYWSDGLSMGSFIPASSAYRVLTIAESISLGLSYLATPYHWGGCSAYSAAHPGLTGVDCSGLIHLLCRVRGQRVPRDAHDQFLSCDSLEPGDLKAGDLVFLAPSERIDHVMLYLGEDRLLESTIAVGEVRCTTGLERVGGRLDTWDLSKKSGKYSVHFGRFSAEHLAVVDEELARGLGVRG